MVRSIILAFTITVLLQQVCIAQHTGTKIIIGNIDNVYSNILKEKRTVWVYVPDNSDSSERFPVLYLLDGDEHFHSNVGIIKQLSGVLPNMIIVGITNTVRERDLTPTKAQASSLLNEGDAKISGGGENFLQFMLQELIPYINRMYPTTSYKAFSGHSLGGLAVINAFVHHTDMFNAYIALEPSLWWDNQKLVKEAEAMLPKAHLDNKALFIALASHAINMDTLAVQKDTLNNNTLLTRAGLTLIHAVKAAGNNGLHFGYRYYPNETHGTVELIGEYDALHSVFSFYHFSTNVFYADPTLNLDSIVVSHYKTVSINLGYTVVPSEDMINDLAYHCMEINRFDEAYRFFKMNIDNHPNSSNAYDSLGDYYDAVGNTKKAIESYERSLSLKETADTRRKLDEQKKK